MSKMTMSPAGPVVLRAETAADLMSPNPLSLRDDATLHEAVAFLVDRGISGAPVIDEAGRPVGVLTQTDLIVHDRESSAGGDPDESRVRDLMTPAVFTVLPDATAAEVVEQLVALNVHRLFVVDGSGLLVGVVSAFDVLQGMRCRGGG